MQLVVLFPIRRCETSASSLKRAKRRQSSRYLFWPAYNASPQREPSIFCMPPVTYVLAMFVTYVLTSDPPERPERFHEAIGISTSDHVAMRKPVPSRGTALDHGSARLSD